MTEFEFVDDPAAIVATLAAADRIGIDTEFLREKTYFAKLCLVQVACAGRHLCVDPLTENDMTAFWDAAFRPEWILHSGRQDIEVIYQGAGRMPTQLFDTQVAAALLGYAPQMGYANLVEELMGVSLPKTHTRADWSRRPLPPALLEYAADDVAYLHEMYALLAERLEKLGRLDWAREDSMLLLDPGLYDIRPEDAVDRLKGARSLRGVRRAIAVRLAIWREQEALDRDRPRQWILKDAAILDMAFRQPTSIAALKKIDAVPPRLAERRGRTLVEIVRAAAADDHAYEPPQPPSEKEKATLKELQRLVAACAKELGVAAEIVASKKELSAAVVSGDFSSRVFTGWRDELIGQKLRTELAG